LYECMSGFDIACAGIFLENSSQVIIIVRFR
jgi:hypothetical protein